MNTQKENKWQQLLLNQEESEWGFFSAKGYIACGPGSSESSGHQQVLEVGHTIVSKLDQWS